MSSSGAPDDYYALLEVEATAGAAELQRAWRRLALQWHPDRAGPSATAMFQKLSAAYAVLSDPVARAAYDRRRNVSTATRSAAPRQPPAAAATKPAPGPAPGVLLSRQSAPLQSLLARGIARWADDDVLELALNAEEAAHGGMVTIPMRVPVRCPVCRGRAAAQCACCSGTGALEELWSAWLAVPPGVADGTVLAPSELLPGMIEPVSFRMRVRAARPA